MRIQFLLWILLVFVAGCDLFESKHQYPVSTISDLSYRDEKMRQNIRNQAETGGYGIIYQSESVKILGDTNIDKNKLYYPQIKFQPYVYFDDFETDTIYNGPRNSINYQSNGLAQRCQLEISDAYNNTPLNFGAFYSLVSWHAASSDLQAALIDCRNGRVYDAPYGVTGYDSRKNSLMLVVNPPDTSGFYTDCENCQPQIWLWDEKGKTFTMLKSKWNQPETK